MIARAARRAAIALFAMSVGAVGSCKKSTPSEPSPATATAGAQTPPSAPLSADWLPEDKLVETVLALNSHVVVMSLSPEFTDYREVLADVERISGQPAHPFVIVEATLDGGHGVVVKGVDPARWL